MITRFVFVHSLASTLSIVIDAETEELARKELDRRGDEIQQHYQMNIPRHWKWECIGRKEVK